MPATTLINIDDPNFNFDHAQEHVSLDIAMGSPSEFNLARYLLDPAAGQDLAAGNWMMVHQTAHFDAMGYYGASPSVSLMDTDITQPSSSRSWWLFANLYEHLTLEQAASEANLG